MAGAGIGQLFTSCVTCFSYVQIGRRFGKSFQTDLLTLKVLEMRLSRWGVAVKVYDDPPLAPLRQQGATDAEVEVARTILQQILLIFEDSAKVSRKFKLNAKLGEDLSTLTVEDLDPATRLATNTMRDLAARRRKGASYVKLTSWALYEKQHLSSLINQITRLLENLEQVFPVPQLEVVLSSHRSQEAEVIRAGVESEENVEGILKKLAEVATRVDKALAAPLKASAEFRDVSIAEANLKENSRMQNGDFVGSSWKGVSNLPKSDRTVKIGSLNAEGDSRVMNGNVYGEGDGAAFWS